MAVGLGGETCWICPTLTQNSTQDITSSGLTITTTGSVTVTADTGAGGTYANFCQGNGTNQSGHEVIIDNFGNTYAQATSVSWWSRRTAGSNVIEMGGGTNQWPTVTSGRFYYQYFSGADRCYMYNTSGGTNGWIYSAGSNATWKHHVMVREGVGGKNRLFINGVLNTTDYDDGGAETTGKDMYFGIGGGGSSNGELYMDDMRTYGRALTQAEITHLATSRGIQGRPFVGLGGEQLWLSPTVANNVNPFDDLSSQGNNGTAQGGLSTITDSNAGGAYAYDFDGIDDFIQLPIAAMDYGSGDWTISFWLSSTQTTGGPLFNNYSGGGATGKYVVLHLNNDGGGTGGTGEIVGTIDDGTTKKDFPAYTATYNDGTWRYFTAIRDNVAGTVSLYEGGSSTPVSQITNTATYGDLSGSQATRIGSWTSLFSRSTLDGRMDDIRYYDRVITQAEITHLATSRGVLGPPGGATHYNPFKSHAFINDFQQRLR